MLHVTSWIMQAPQVYLWLFTQLFPGDVFAMSIRSLAEGHSDAATIPVVNEHWSKQDLLTLLGVCVAIVTVVIGLAGLLVASPSTRKWLCKPVYWFAWRVQRSSEHPSVLSPKCRTSTIKNWRKNRKQAHQQLQDRYNELLEMRRGRF
ncbi:hypothetical protein CUC08_Gglean007509 [Alternaria sp. MG1]|nr:hypothetical protein CUC08_Gglean007509 [Alternaria sp. MG1]